MSDNENENDNNYTYAQIEEHYKPFYEHMQKLGVDLAICKAFVCFRHHGLHPWGLAPVTVNGYKAAAVVCPSDSENKATMVFLAIPPNVLGLKIVDMCGDTAGEDRIITINIPKTSQH